MSFCHPEQSTTFFEINIHYHQPKVRPLPAIINAQVATWRTIQKVLNHRAFFTSDCVIGRNSGLSSSLMPTGIPTVLAHTLSHRRCPLKPTLLLLRYLPGCVQCECQLLLFSHCVRQVYNLKPCLQLSF